LQREKEEQKGKEKERKIEMRERRRKETQIQNTIKNKYFVREMVEKSTIRPDFLTSH
jgi:hypothetical protein